MSAKKTPRTKSAKIPENQPAMAETTASVAGPSERLAAIKAEARRIRDAGEMKLGKALEAAARAAGFKDWHAAQTALSREVDAAVPPCAVPGRPRLGLMSLDAFSFQDIMLVAMGGSLGADDDTIARIVRKTPAGSLDFIIEITPPLAEGDADLAIKGKRLAQDGSRGGRRMPDVEKAWAPWMTDEDRAAAGKPFDEIAWARRFPHEGFATGMSVGLDMMSDNYGMKARMAIPLPAGGKVISPWRIRPVMSRGRAAAGNSSIVFTPKGIPTETLRELQSDGFEPAEISMSGLAALEEESLILGYWWPSFLPKREDPVRGGAEEGEGPHEVGDSRSEAVQMYSEEREGRLWLARVAYLLPGEHTPRVRYFLCSFDHDFTWAADLAGFNMWPEARRRAFLHQLVTRFDAATSAGITSAEAHEIRERGGMDGLKSAEVKALPTRADHVQTTALGDRKPEAESDDPVASMLGWRNVPPSFIEQARRAVQDGHPELADPSTVIVREGGWNDTLASLAPRFGTEDGFMEYVLQIPGIGDKPDRLRLANLAWRSHERRLGATNTASKPLVIVRDDYDPATGGYTRTVDMNGLHQAVLDELDAEHAAKKGE